jgi:hypothetical protein
MIGILPVMAPMLPVWLADISRRDEQAGCSLAMSSWKLDFPPLEHVSTGC